MEYKNLIGGAITDKISIYNWRACTYSWIT